MNTKILVLLWLTGIVSLSLGSCASAQKQAHHKPTTAAQQDLNRQLWEALYAENLPAIRRSLNQGADINAYNPQGVETPVLYALAHSPFAFSKFLIDQGANVNATDKQGVTALAYAPFVRRAEYLVTHGARWKTMSELNKLLRLAASEGKLPLVKFWQKHGAQIDGRDAQGNTPLLKASESGHLAVVIYLVTQSANITAMNKQGETALSYAQITGNTDIVNYLTIQASTQE